MIRIGSLFSGIGGLELGLESGLASTGWPAQTVYQIEQSEYCRSILARHWPNAQRFDDVRTIDPASLPPADLLCGGFPCQDLSVAGKRRGLDGERSGLFFELARIVRTTRPRIVVLENVPGIYTSGLGTVLGALAEDGYDCVWTSLQAAEVGAPHRRERWLCVAWLADHDSERSDTGPRMAAQRGADLSDSDRGDRRCSSMAHTNGGKSQMVWNNSGMGRQCQPASRDGDGEAETQSRMGRDAHGFPSRLDGHRWPAGPGSHQHDWEPPRTRPRQPNDRERLKALGNAVVPQQAAVIGRWVGEHLLRRGA